jgi:citrate lyase beta subunit
VSLFRTFLFAPGNHARRVEKALTLGADAVILDLEDAVAVSEKVATRATVVAALRAPRRCRGYVRVNAAGTEWGFADLLAVVRPGVDGIVLPKVEGAGQLRAVEWAVGALERGTDCRRAGSTSSRSSRRHSASPSLRKSRAPAPAPGESRSAPGISPSISA